jgi:hypothetical protein
MPFTHIVQNLLSLIFGFGNIMSNDMLLKTAATAVLEASIKTSTHFVNKYFSLDWWL